MITITEIQNKLKEFNNFAKQTSDPGEYQSRWRELFHLPLSSQSANSFVSYYRDMRSNTRRRNNRRSRKQQRGGSAPLDYSMTPGMNIQAYGRFPVEAGTDPASVRNLDVYFRDSLTADCGVKDSSLQVPANMGSNKVGGRRSRRATHRPRRTQRRNRRRTQIRQRGGDLLESITARAPFVYNSSVAPGALQQLSHAWSGSTTPVPAPDDPSIPTWEARTHGVAGTINPGLVAYVPNDVGKIANPAPWMSSS